MVSDRLFVLGVSLCPIPIVLGLGLVRICSSDQAKAVTPKREPNKGLTNWLNTANLIKEHSLKQGGSDMSNIEVHSSGKVLRVALIVGNKILEEKLIALNSLPVGFSNIPEIICGEGIRRPLIVRDDDNTDIGHKLCLPDNTHGKITFESAVFETSVEKVTGSRDIDLTPKMRGKIAFDKDPDTFLLFQFVVAPPVPKGSDMPRPRSLLRQLIDGFFG